MTLQTRNAPEGCVVLAVTNHPRYPGEEVEIICPLVQLREGETPTVDESFVGSYPAKQVIGDYRKTSHQVLSSLTQASWAGGGQIDESSESEDLDRYSGICSLETRFPNHLMLLPLTVTLAGPNSADPRVLGDFFHGSAWHLYVAFGVALREMEGDFPDSLALSGSWTLTDAVVGDCAVFPISGEPNLFIPQGAGNGYQTFDGTNLDAQVTTIKPIQFMTHSNKIWALDAAGVLWKSVNGTNWTQAIALNPGTTPRGVIPYLDRADVPAPHLITDAGVYAMDESVPAIYLTELNYAPHPYAGLAFEVWRTDLYVAIGMGVQRYTGGTVNAAGLDRDDGPHLNGYISSLERGFNDLFAGVTPIAQAGGATEDVFVDQGLEVYIGAVRDTAAVMRLTGGQAWHTLWRAPSSGGTVRDVTVSRANDDYRVVWSWNGLLHASRLTVGFDNPKHNPESLFAEDGELISPWLDMNLEVDRKTLASLETRADEDTDAGDEFDINLQIDDDDITEVWRPVATVQSGGRHEYRLGENGQFPTTQAVQTRYDGLGFLRARYRITMRRHAEHQGHSPTMKNIVAVYRPRMRRLRNFSFAVDCSNPEHDQGWGLSNGERRKVLQELIESETFVPLMYGQEWIMVQLPYVQGPRATGIDDRGNVNVSALEAWEMTT